MVLLGFILEFWGFQAEVDFCIGLYFILLLCLRERPFFFSLFILSVYLFIYNLINNLFSEKKVKKYEIEYKICTCFFNSVILRHRLWKFCKSFIIVPVNDLVIFPFPQIWRTKCSWSLFLLSTDDLINHFYLDFI